MMISNVKKIKNKYNNGFTLIELIIVISGLAALSAFAIPSYMDAIKLNKIEQVKAIINGYAADCLTQYRLLDDTQKAAFNDPVNGAEPTQLNKLELSTLGYQIDVINKNVPNCR